MENNRIRCFLYNFPIAGGLNQRNKFTYIKMKEEKNDE